MTFFMKEMRNDSIKRGCAEMFAFGIARETGFVASEICKLVTRR